MEFKEIKDYLDRLILINGASKGYEKLSDRIEAIMFSDNIQLYKGIEAVADAMGLEIGIEQRGDGETRYSFTYSGVEFFQLGSSTEKECCQENEHLEGGEI